MEVGAAARLRRPASYLAPERVIVGEERAHVWQTRG
jgi:hypothetical protein